MAIIGIGAALVDILVTLGDENLLLQTGHPKGSMVYVDQQQQQYLLTQITSQNPVMACGGSAANAINGVARLGGVQTAFIGQIGKDNMGQTFSENLVNNDVKPLLAISDNEATGSVISMVTPDKERTMATRLGAASMLDAAMLTDSMFEGQKILFVEGYLIYNGPMIERVMTMAKEHGMLVAFDMASYNIVEENKDYMTYLIDKYVDIIFANEQEARSFTGFDATVSLGILASRCKIAVVKLGASGSLIQSGERVERIGVIDSAVPVDKTAAGDLYAAGFLWGLANDLPLKQCGEIGAVLSSRVIEVFGSMPTNEMWEDIQHRVQNVRLGLDALNGVETLQFAHQKNQLLS